MCQRVTIRVTADSHLVDSFFNVLNIPLTPFFDTIKSRWADFFCQAEHPCHQLQ